MDGEPGRLKRTRRALTRPSGLVLILIVGFMISPIIGLLTTTTLADGLSCTVDEGMSHPCLLLGHDIGELLYFGFVSTWFVFVTFPLGGILLCVWSAVMLAKALHRRRKGPRPGIPR